MTTIGIAGGSGSGKTTLAAAVAARLRAPLLSHDMYYRVPLPAHVRGNWDHPDSYDNPYFLHHLDSLLSGSPVMVPVYRFGDGGPVLGAVEVGPSPLVVVEGIMILAVPEIRSRLGFKIFVDCPESVRLQRRVRRDTTERGRTEAQVRLQWAETVSPMHRLHVEPSRAHAGVVVDGESDFAEVVECVVASHKT